ncbi:hypothetical protein [Sphingomonas sp.]|jgi:hypothetical protein|uniref:hypothetical protein n=1 Tax=Sphingomonas sp. TaxID=28214 RepID=UPI0017B53BF1|nr:hypothetical protein [Sphingomonas sp.]MBA3512314.1 hypothetical protein [Sphingomonas sp.]
MAWSSKQQSSYAAFMHNYVRNYSQPIDCADLALAGLATFAGQNALPVRLFDYEERPKRWLAFDPATDDWQRYSRRIRSEMGAINVIENSRAITLEHARAGDLIMTQNHGGGSTGHTRIITSIQLEEGQNDYLVEWYQGNLPPVVPERREALFRTIPNVYGASPRRWRFDQFH